MLDRPDGFDDAIRQGGKLETRCDVLSNGLPVAGLTGLPISSASVQVDRTSFVRRSCTLTIADPDLAAAVATGGSGLAPFGNEVRLFRGLDGFMLPVGTFGIRDTSVDDPALSVTITGKDRMQRVIEARFGTTRAPANFSIVGMIKRLYQEAVPWARLDDADVDPTIVDHTSGAVSWTRDRQGAITDLAGSLGAEANTDPLGGLVIAPIPSVTGFPVWMVDAGPNGVLVSANRKQTRDGMYNAVVATSTASGLTGVTSGVDGNGDPVVRDDDPNSRTYYFGQFGKVPTFYDSPLLTTSSQCLIAAQGVLRNYIGVPSSVALTAVPQPALQEGDVIGVRYSDGSIERHLVDQMSFGFGASDAMSIASRSTSSNREQVS